MPNFFPVLPPPRPCTHTLFSLRKMVSDYNNHAHQDSRDSVLLQIYFEIFFSWKIHMYVLFIFKFLIIIILSYFN